MLLKEFQTQVGSDSGCSLIRKSHVNYLSCKRLRKKLPTKQGISSTLYDLQRTQTLSAERLSNMQSGVQSIKSNIKFSNCIPPVANTTTRQNTMYGQLIVGSPLSIHQNPLEYSATIKLNLLVVEIPLYIEHEYQALPTHFTDQIKDII